MIRAILLSTYVSSAAAAVSTGVLTDALKSNLRATQTRAASEVSLDAQTDLASAVEAESEESLSVQAGRTLEALLDVATDTLSEHYYLGLAAPLNQQGYEQSLGNPAMTAFITKYMESKDLSYTDADALQGFVMYYDGSCHKKAFKDLEEEMGGTFVGSCHGTWITNSASMLEFGRTVTNKEFKAMLQKESIMMRAAAYSAAGSVDGPNSLAKIRKFVHEYINELNGNVLNELKLEAFIEHFVTKYGESEDALEKLTDELMAEGERKGGCVEMPKLASRTVKLHASRPERKAMHGIGTYAPLDESGYNEVADTKDNAQMVAFIHRTAESMGLSILESKEASAVAFAKWYDSSCAKQTFAALQSELTSEILRPTICGGGWVAPSSDEEKEVDATELFVSTRRHAHKN